jgi:hypothetical protein
MMLCDHTTAVNFAARRLAAALPTASLRRHDTMGRIAAVFCVLIMLLVSGAGWITARPSLAPFLVPGATNVQVVPLGWGTWQFSYDVAGSPTTWYTDIPRQLEAQRWSSMDRVEYGAMTRTYNRTVSFGVCELWEWAFLTFDPLQPNVAHIIVRRWVAIPWWRHLAKYYRLSGDQQV